MKSKSLLLLIFAGTLLAACGCFNGVKKDGSDTIWKPQSPDTVRTVILYMDRVTGSVKGELALKVHKDMEALDSVGPGTFKKTNKRDSIYLVAVWEQLSDNGKPRLDSLGKPVYKATLQPLDKTFLLQDYNKVY